MPTHGSFRKWFGWRSAGPDGYSLYHPDIFSALKKTRKRHEGKGEFTQTDAINHLAENGRVAVKRFEGRVLDVGTPLGYLQAIVEYGLTRDSFRAPLLAFLREIVENER